MANPGFNVVNNPNPYEYATAITPSDTVNIGKTTRAIYVGVSGNITAVMEDGSAVLFKAVPVGILPIRAIRVNETATAATDMVALF